MLWYYCQLCAEIISSEGLCNLEKKEEKCKDILIKLAFFKLDFSDRLEFPKTICLDCDDSLSKAYDFLIKIKKAQDVFSGLLQTETKMEQIDQLEDFNDKAVIILQNVKNEDLSENEDSYTLQTNDTDIVDEINTENSFKKTLNNPVIKVQANSDIPATSCNDLVSKEASDKNFDVISKGSSDKNIQSWTEYHWTCGICYMELPDINTLRAHCINIHNKCAEYACFICEKIFNFNSFVLHARGHHYNLRNRCHYCDATVDHGNLDSHIDQHLQTLRSCTMCGMTFPDDTSLQNHLDSVIQKKQKKTKKGKPTKAPEEDRTCPICKKVFNYVSALKKHMMIHSSDRRKEFTCELCGTMFYDKGTLSQHLTTHSDERSHVCNICGMSYRQGGNLRRHMTTHSKKMKNFSCEKCGRYFARKSQLKYHIVRHTDVCPFVCQICNKRFHFKWCLAKHERQHNGVRPYSCDECDRTFADWGNWNKHMKRRHNRNMAKKKNLKMVENFSDET